MLLLVAAAADEFSVSFAIIVAGALFSFVAVVCLLILTASSHRRCFRHRGTRTDDRPVHTVSDGLLEPRLVGFTNVNRGAHHHDDVSMTFVRTDDGGKQSTADHEEQRRGLAEQVESTTSDRVKSTYKRHRRDCDERPPAVSSCLDTRSVSVPVIMESRTDHRGTDHRCRIAGLTTTPVVSARVDSGVSGMQSSVCTLSSSATQQLQQQPDVEVEADEWSRAQSTDCVDADVGTSPVLNLSQMSMDVRSCPGGTSGITLLPPLFLCQYVNGYSDAMLMHVADRQRHPASHSSDVDHTASTTATHCATDADDESGCRGVETDTVPSTSHGALTIQTKAIIEPRPASHQSAEQSPCVCGQSHDLSPSADPDLPPLPSNDIYDPPLSTTIVRNLPPSLHLPPPPSSVSDQPLDLPRPPDCDRESPPLDDAVNVIKATTPSSPSEVERRRLLTRILLGLHDELVLSPVYLDETYF